MHVESAMVESALNVAAEMVLEYSRNGIEMRRAGNRGPGATPQGVYSCRGDDKWVALAALDDAARTSLAELIGHPALAGGPVARAGRRSRQADLGLDRGHSVAEAVDALRAGGVAAAPVTPAAALLRDPQLLARGFWEKVDHPVAGSFLCTGMPFVFAGRPRHWIRRVPPLYGQHTGEVLTGVLGYNDEDVARVARVGGHQRAAGGVVTWRSPCACRRAPASCAHRCASCSAGTPW